MSQEDIVKRPKYFAGQYLLEDDFELEQNYHIDRQRRYTRLLTVSGIADGLEVAARDGQVYVNKGTAIAPDGTQIVWVADETPINLSSETVSSGTYTLSIGYSEVDSPEDLQEGSAEEYRRCLEQPVFSLKSPILDGYIPLAKLTVNGQRQFSCPNDSDSVRQYSGLRLPSSNGVSAPTLRSSGSNNPSLAVLSGSLKVTDNASVDGTLMVKGTSTLAGVLTVTGSSTLSGKLTVNNEVELKGAGTPDKIGLIVNAQGNVGIGITNPSSRLLIAGDKATATIDPKEIIRLVRLGEEERYTPNGRPTNFQRANSASFSLGSFEAGPQAASRLDIKLTNTTSNSNQWGAVPDSVVMTLQGDGCIGIGSTTPKSMLSVAGGVAIGSKFVGEFTASDGQLLVQESLLVGKKIGIGTITPTAGLEIDKKNTNDVALLLNSAGAGWGSGIQFKNTASTGRVYGIYSGSDGNWHFADQTDNADQIVINSNGQVSITNALSVNGSLTVNSPVYLKGATNKAGLAVSSQGTVTINSKISNIPSSFNFDNDAVPLTLFDNTGNVPNNTRDILRLVREGVSGKSYGNMVAFAVGRYSNASVDSYTQFDIKLTGGTFNAHKTLMTMKCSSESSDVEVFGKLVADPNYAISDRSDDFFAYAESVRRWVFPDETGGVNNSLQVTITTHGKPVLVTANLPLKVDNGVTISSAVNVTIFREGSDGTINLAINPQGVGLGTQNRDCFQSISLAQPGQDIPVAIMFVDQPPAGTYKYKVALFVNNGEFRLSSIEKYTRKSQIAVVELN